MLLLSLALGCGSEQQLTENASPDPDPTDTTDPVDTTAVSYTHLRAHET